MSDQASPVFVSRRRFKNFWQEYRIYSDRVELQSWLTFRTFKIPLSEIELIEVRPPLVLADVMRLRSGAIALKIDGADCCRHVALKRKGGLFKFIRFTPDDPDRFVEVCRSITGSLPTI